MLGGFTPQDPGIKSRMRPPASEQSPFRWSCGWRRDSGWQWGWWVAVGQLLQLRHLLHIQRSFCPNQAIWVRSYQKPNCQPLPKPSAPSSSPSICAGGAGIATELHHLLPPSLLDQETHAWLSNHHLGHSQMQLKNYLKD